MKLFKRFMGIVVLVCSVFFIIQNVSAITVDELNASLDRVFVGDEIVPNAISPASISDNTYRETYIEGLVSYLSLTDKNNVLNVVLSEDYSSLYIQDCSEDNNSCVSSKTKKIKWADADSNHLNDVLNFVKANHFHRYMDMDSLDMVFSDILDDDDYFNTDHIKKYLEKLNSNSMISFDVISYLEEDNGSAVSYSDDSIDFSDLSELFKFHEINYFAYHVLNIKYDGIIYYSVLPYLFSDNNEANFELYDYSVLFIPSSTSETVESYVSAALQKIKAYYPNVEVTVTTLPQEELLEVIYNSLLAEGIPLTDEIKLLCQGWLDFYMTSLYQFGYDNHLIDSNLNSSFAPVMVKIMLGNKAYSMIVVKGSDAQLTKYVPDSLKSLNDSYMASIVNNNNSSTNNSSTNNPSGKDEIENPQTGMFLNVGLLTVALIAASIIIYFAKHKKSIYKI